MGGPENLLGWHNLIFDMPLLIAVLFLLASAARPHGHGGVHGHGATGHGAPAAAVQGHTAQGAATHAPGAHGARLSSHNPTTRPVAHGDASGAKVAQPKDMGPDLAIAAAAAAHAAELPEHAPLLLSIIGAQSAPLPLVLEAGAMGWGMCGIFANLAFVRAANPGLLLVIPSVAVAGVGALLSMRVAGAVISRLMPKDETQVVSRDSLYGLTGKVVYPVTATGGRVHVYDAFGTLHDEPCRVLSGTAVLQRGAAAMVVDMDATGRLIVEEVPGASLK